MTEAARREMIRRRQRESLAWKLIHHLGSLRLALVLLATIGVACAIATFAESKFDARVAQDYVYKAPWFLLWLGVLCVNLAAATLTRWPWQRKHTGFIVTHAGIITLLIGAVVGMKTGFEAHLTLTKGHPPTNRLVINETILQVDSPRDGAIYTMPLPVQTRVPTESRPRRLPVPDSSNRLLIDGYETHLLDEQVLVVSDAPGAGPGVVLRFHSAMMGQEVEVALSLREGATRDFFGLARVELRDPGTAAAAGTPERVPVNETHVIFANAPETPVIHPHAGSPSGVRVRLEREADNSFSVTPGKGAPRPLQEVVGTTLTENGIEFEVADFWPDFVMREGVPVSASEEPKNPAILVRVTGSVAAPEDRRPVLTLFPEGDGLRFQVSRVGEVTHKGHVAEGDTIVPGWADWNADVARIFPRAQFRPEQRPVTPEAAGAESAAPGIRARLIGPDGQQSEPVWVRSGRSEALSMGGEIVRVGFGLKTRRIPFSVELLNFEVPRDEGTDTPANFISTLRFLDPESGFEKEAVSRMNHPASFPGGFWPTTSGQTYKFSQASWNPENLDETTLQILFDPGWIFKWIGSLMICAGIAVMFYMKPYGRVGNRAPADEPASAL